MANDLPAGVAQGVDARQRAARRSDIGGRRISSRPRRAILVRKVRMRYILACQRYSHQIFVWSSRMRLLDWLPGMSAERRKLRSSNPSDRAEAINQIGRSKDRKAVKLLIRVLRADKDRLPRVRAAGELGDLGSPEAVEPLIEALRTDKDGGVRGMAADALGKLRDRKAVEPLIEALRTDPGARWNAAEALCHLEDARATQALVEAVQNDDLAWNVANALARTRSTKVPLSRELAHALLSAHCFEKFASYGPQAVELVLPSVEQFIAAGLIGKARETLAFIRRALEFEPLSKASMPEAAARVRGYLDACPVDAASLLGALKDVESIGILESRLSTGDWQQSREFARVLRKLGYGKTIGEIARLLSVDRFAEAKSRRGYHHRHSLPPGVFEAVTKLDDGADAQLEAKLIDLEYYNDDTAEAKFWALSRVGYFRTIEYLSRILREGDTFADVAADALTRVVSHRLSRLDKQTLQRLERLGDGIQVIPYDEGPYGERPASTEFVRRLAGLELKRRKASAG
jgi:HEAT repeat protein